MWKNWGRQKRARKRDRKRKTKRWNEKKKESMWENKSKRPTSVTHYPPGPLSGNRSIWHNSQQTSLWLQMGVDGRGVKVIQGKDAKGMTDLSHTEQKNRKQKNPLCPQSTVPSKGKSSFIQHGKFFVPVLDIILIGDNNIVHTMLIAEIWQCCNIAKQKSDWAGNISSQTIRQVVNKPPG